MDITREQLYELLWSKGVGKTEEALGLKQHELQKICDDYQIPKPSSNYWISLKLGKSPERTPLPPLEDNPSIRTEDYIKRQPIRIKKEKITPQAEPLKKTPDGKYEPQALPPEVPVTIYTVPEKLVAMDPILMDTKQKLREHNGRKDNPWSKKNPYKSDPKKWLDITVSQEQEDRALRIFSTIWRAAEAHGYSLKISVDKSAYYHNCLSYFLVRNHEIRVELTEINNRVKEEGNYWTKLVNTGRLKFTCDRGDHRYSFDRKRVAAQDTDYTRIEDKIEHIIKVMEAIADERDQVEVERKLAEERRIKEEELKRQEAERKRKEEEEQARIEKRRQEERDQVMELLFESERVRTAALIREYASQYEEEMASKLSPEDLQAKLQWMHDKADFIDPFIQRKDEWLQPKDIGRLLSPEITKTTETRRPSSYGYGNETTYSYWQIKNMWWRR